MKIPQTFGELIAQVSASPGADIAHEAARDMFEHCEIEVMVHGLINCATMCGAFGTDMDGLCSLLARRITGAAAHG